VFMGEKNFGRDAALIPAGMSAIAVPGDEVRRPIAGCVQRRPFVESLSRSQAERAQATLLLAG